MDGGCSVLARILFFTGLAPRGHDAGTRQEGMRHANAPPPPLAFSLVVFGFVSDLLPIRTIPLEEFPSLFGGKIGGLGEMRHL